MVDPEGLPTPGLSEPASSPELTVTVHQLVDAVVVEVTGELDMITTPRLQQTLQQVLEDPPAMVVVDLAAVTFLGSSGLAVLVEARETAAQRTRLRLVADGPAVVRPLQVTGLEGRFSSYPTRTEALTTDSAT